MPDCIFCSIANGDTSAEVVFEDGDCIAFLDHRPLFPGHTLIIPREHHVTISDLPDGLIQPLFRNVQALAGAVERSMDAAGTFVAMNNKVSQSVPHLHVHVVPRRPKDGLRGFFWPRTKYTDAEHMANVAEAIRKEVLL